MDSPTGRGLLSEGERVLLIDAKSRRYLLTLTSGRAFHTHAGIVQHDDLIGQVEGSSVSGSTGRSFLLLRPTLSDLVLKMPRGAQVIYPKDIGAILLAADIGPGQRVFEAGVGSGALLRLLDLRPDSGQKVEATAGVGLVGKWAEAAAEILKDD